MVLGAVLAAVALVAASPPGRAFITEKRALKNGADAYLYGYPLVTMLATEAAFHGAGDPTPWLNRFVHLQYLPDAATRAVVRPNRDTLYSLAWLDLSDGPQLITTPDMGDRYWLMPVLDAWTDVVGTMGTRTSGNLPGRHLVVGPGWDGPLPAGVDVIRSPTPLVWVLGRIEVDGPADIPAVAALQEGFSVAPYRDGAAGTPAPAVTLTAADAGAAGSVRAQVDAMDARAFFTALADGLAQQPPLAADGPALDNLARFGIRPGQPFDWDGLDDATRQGLEEAVGRVQQGMTEAFRNGDGSPAVNGWRIPPRSLGAYGTDYPLRAVVAREGLGANRPEDAVYATATADSAGQPLDGSHTYELVVTAPPADAFWSVTTYTAEGGLVPGADGHESVRGRAGTGPEQVRIVVSRTRQSQPDALWLVPPEGPFSLMLRLYAPRPAALDGSWAFPQVRRVGG